MTKAILPICTFLFLAASTQAQSTSGQPVRLGIKAAPNLAWVKSDTKELEGDGMKFGFLFGLMSDFRLGSDNYALSTGLFMNVTGANMQSRSFDGVDGNGNTVKVDQPLAFSYKYQFVEVPITIKLKTNEIGYMTYFGTLGFGSAYNVSAKGDEYSFNDSQGIEREEDANVLKEMAVFRASLIVGAGLEYNIAGNTSIMAGINYNNSFTDVFDKSEMLGVEQHGKLHYLELNFGVFF